MAGRLTPKLYKAVTVTRLVHEPRAEGETKAQAQDRRRKARTQHRKALKAAEGK